MGLVRYGLHWNGPTDFICTEMADGYWTHWHVAESRLEAEREKVRVLRGAILDIVEQSRDWSITSIAEEALIETAEDALQATAQGGGE